MIYYYSRSCARIGSFMKFLIFSFIIGICLGFAARFLLQQFSPATLAVPHKNLGLYDRLVRLAIALVLAALGLYFESSLCMIAAGFSFFEAFAQWCVLYALIGKNSCPL